MPPQKSWGFDPNSGGKKTENVKWITERINKEAEAHFRGRYTHLDIRFRAKFCYIDAYAEPVARDCWPPAGWLETREEYIERLQTTPIHLCRLRYFGNDRWGFAFYTYSNERYELFVFPTGDFFGKPEDAFIVSAELYLNE